MLKKIEIRNFLTIEYISLIMDDKLTAIIGESGAGKSLILKAIEDVFAQKTPTDIIGGFGTESIIKLLFNLENEQLSIMSKFGIKEDEILIEKIIKPGKTKAYINHEPVSSRVLYEIKDTLLTVVSQNYNFGAFDSDNVLNIIDKIIDKKIKKEFETAYSDFVFTLNEKKGLENQVEVISEKHPEILIESIERTNPKSGEYEELLNLTERIKSSSVVKEKITKMVSLLYESDDGIEKTIKDFELSAEKINSLGFKADNIQQAFEEISSIIHNIKNDLYSLINNTDDEKDVDAIESRLFELEQLQRKFAKSIEQIIEEKEHLIDLIHTKEKLEFDIEKINKEIEQKLHSLNEKAERLSQERKRAAMTIEKKIKEILNEMLLKNSVVKFDFSNKKVDKTGKDLISILFSANPDIKAQNIDKIASGGERSRFILAMESSHSAAANTKETIILDEIESGISNKTLESMCEVIKELSLKNQIIIITHNEKLSNIANSIQQISKKFNGGITKSFKKKIK